VRRHRFDGDREEVRAAAVRVALEELSGLLEGEA
jgi:nicotinamide mononucleotide (NMN) deamidase PncC